MPFPNIRTQGFDTAVNSSRAMALRSVPLPCPSPVTPPPWLPLSTRQLPSSTLRSAGSFGRSSLLSVTAALVAAPRAWTRPFAHRSMFFVVSVVQLLLALPRLF